MLQLQLFCCDPLDPAVIAEGVFFRIRFRHSISSASRSSTICSRCAVNKRVWWAVVTTVTAVTMMQMNKQSGSFPNRKRSSPITPGKAWRSLLLTNP